MKFEKNKTYAVIAKYAFWVIIASVGVILLLENFGSVFNFFSKIFSSLASVTWGIVFAYLLNPILSFFEKKVFKKIKAEKKRSRLRRAVSMVTTYLILIAVLVLFVLTFVPQIVDNYDQFYENFGTVEKAVESIKSYISNNDLLSRYQNEIFKLIGATEDTLLEDAYSLMSNIVIPYVLKLAVSLAESVYVIIIGLILSIYLLANKEKVIGVIKKISRAVFTKKHYYTVGLVIKTTDDNFGKYLRGKIIDSIIVGIVSYIIYWICGYEYYPILALIAGVTNMIPFFGPFIGAVPAGIIVLIAQPDKLIFLFIIILVLQQLDGNILDPLIVSDAVGLIPVFTMSATLFFGDIFGIAGMLLGVPTLATVYTFIRQYSARKLQEKGMSSDTRDYYPGCDPFLNEKDTENTDINTDLNEGGETL